MGLRRFADPVRRQIGFSFPNPVLSLCDDKRKLFGSVSAEFREQFADPWHNAVANVRPAAAKAATAMRGLSI